MSHTLLRRAVAVAAAGAALVAGMATQGSAATGTSVVSIGTAKLRDCAAKYHGRASGVSTQTWTAKREGYLRARLSGSELSDFDLALFDAVTRRSLEASAGFGSTELASTYVLAGQKVIAQICRRTGRDRSARLSLAHTALDVTTLKPNLQAALAEVQVDSPLGKAALENLGLDLGDHGDANGIPVFLHSVEDRRKLDQSGYHYRLTIPSIHEEAKRYARQDAAYASKVRTAQARAAAVPSQRTSYRQYVDYQNDLKAFVQSKPGLVRALTLPGKSSESRDIEGIEIAGDVNRQADGRPVFFIMGLHHAREWPSAEATIEFAFDLVNGYGTNPRIKALLDKVRVQVVPVMNPDGFIQTRKYDDSALNLPSNGTLVAAVAGGGSLSYRRKNCRSTTGVPASAPCELKNGVDNNRNYGARWGGPGTTSDPTAQTFRGTGPFSEPENQAIRDALLKLNFTNLITNHTFTGLVLRPPGTQFDPPSPDEPAMKALGDAMGDATSYISQMGFQLYDTTGTTEDWSYSAIGAYGYTYEIGKRNFHPAYSEFALEYDGRPIIDKDGNTIGKRGGLREGFLLAAENAGDPEHHSVLEGTAPRGLKLRAAREYKTVTSDRFENGTEGRPTETLDEKRNMLTEVPANGRFEWHVPPSRRPYEQGQQPYTVTCENDAGKVFETQKLFLERGQRLNVFFDCGGVPSATVANACTLTMSKHPSKLSSTGYVRRRILCSKDAEPFEGTLRLEVTRGKKAGAAATTILGLRSVKLAAGRRTLVKIRLTAKGRRIVRRAGRLKVNLVALQPRTKNRLARIATAPFTLKVR